MTPDPDVPPGIAAIMAAIRQEVAAPPVPPAAAAAAPATVAEPESAPAPPALRSEDAARSPAAAPSPLAIDAEARALLAPMLRDWLDRNLPEIVERAVHAELRRLTGQ